MNRGIRLAVVLLMACLLSWPSRACTIFVLVDGERALFFNNEDFSNPRTRMWFVPAGKDFLGCVYVGFDDGWAQGGMNSEGLAFDWVAGFQDKYEVSGGMKGVRGNSSQRMLETCRTVKEAIDFYQTHGEVEFSRARILVADRTGASVIIGARDGKTLVERETECRGFGYGQAALKRLLTAKSEATVENGVKILRAALQDGEFATKYSNVFDLKTGDVFLFRLAESENAVKLNLAAELAKGAHYYDLPEIKSQAAQPPKPLLNNMKRFLLDEYKAIPDTEPKLTARLTRIMRQAARGELNEDDYTTELWKELAGQEQKIRADLQKLGTFKSMILMKRLAADSEGMRRYRVNFSGAAILQTFTLNQDGRIAASESEATDFFSK
jgi:hypothetical protein